MEDAHKEWQVLEKASGQSIYVKTGCIQVIKEQLQYHEMSLKYLQKYNAPYELLDPQTLKKQYPLLKFSDEYKVILDKDGGVILADKGLAALQEQIRKNKADIIDNCTVTEIVPGSKVTVKSSKGIFESKSVILCLGPWTRSFVSKLGVDLPIQPQRPYYMYWKETEVGSHTIQNGMPTFLDIDVDIYGFPSLEYPGLVKVCFDGGIPFDIDIPGDDEKTHAKLDELCAYVRDHLPGLETYPEVMGKCKYSVTPDHKFILDKHPKYSNIIIGAGFSGKGFKFAPIVGIILRDLALGQQPKYDISAFKINRFG